MLVECGQYKSTDKFDYTYSGLDGVAQGGYKKSSNSQYTVKTKNILIPGRVSGSAISRVNEAKLKEGGVIDSDERRSKEWFWAATK